MDIKKILIILLVLTVYINYNNYFKEDKNKIIYKILNIDNKILREKKLNKRKKIIKDIDMQELFYSPKKYDYSKAMGKLQNHIKNSAKNLCIIKKIKWSQVTTSANWYDRLKMEVYLSCKPTKFLKFINKLKNDKKLYNITYLKASKIRGQDSLSIVFTIVGYRIR